MSKLRKMLGDIHDESVIELMNLISTQSHSTLLKWGLNCIQEELSYLNNQRLYEIESELYEYLNGQKTIKEIKPFIKESRDISKDYQDPVEVAAAFAICTAFGIATTPTNSLGFTFYHAAYVIYRNFGLQESRTFYDLQASILYKQILQSLKDIQIKNENDPVKVNWNC